MQKPDRATYTPTDFLEWREAKSLELTPKFQRRGVWKRAARSFFIDSILREMPVPPIYLRIIQSPERTKVTREVVDGQQRVAAVLDFIDGEYRLSSSLDNKWAGKTFNTLTPTEKTRILSFGFPSEVFHGVSDLEVLEMFARLNTYSVPLNAQELRNGRYFGFFKHSAYVLAHEHLEFWRRHGVFTERSIARMLEVEFVSEVMIASLDGMQDKKKSIDEFYLTFDEKFPRQRRVEQRFRDAADEINEAMNDELRQTEFHRSPLLYTLFCVVLHRLFGLPKVRIATPMKGLSRTEQLKLRETLATLSEMVSAARSDEPVPSAYQSFVVACLRQTDNIKPREERFRTVYQKTFG
jgi:uncharacterized protein DUF262